MVVVVVAVATVAVILVIVVIVVVVVVVVAAAAVIITSPTQCLINDTLLPPPPFPSIRMLDCVRRWCSMSTRTGSRLPKVWKGGVTCNASIDGRKSSSQDSSRAHGPRR